MTKTFKEIIDGIRTAILGIEVREDIAQGMEYVEQFATTATKKAGEAATSAAKAEKASQDTEAAKETAVRKAAAAAGSASNAAKSEKNSKASANAAQEYQIGAESAQKKAEDAAKRAAAIVSTDKTLSIDGAPADAKATGDALAGKLPLSGGTMTGPIIMPGGGSVLSIKDNAATHNMVYRGKALGGSVTSEQWAAIKAGTFKDLYLGDYWSIGGMNYIIAAFDYWYKCGDTACYIHHAAVIPQSHLYTYKFNPTNTTEGGYVGSDLYKNGLTQAKQMVAAAFGSAHILNHREYLVNAVTNGAPTGTDWYDSTVELMNENMVYGSKQLSPMSDGTDPWNACRNHTIDKSQLPLFWLAPRMEFVRDQGCWLRDIASAARCAISGGYGTSSVGSAGNTYGVWPVFGLIG